MSIHYDNMDRSPGMMDTDYNGRRGGENSWRKNDFNRRGTRDRNRGGDTADTANTPTNREGEKSYIKIMRGNLGFCPLDMSLINLCGVPSIWMDPREYAKGSSEVISTQHGTPKYLI